MASHSSSQRVGARPLLLPLLVALAAGAGCGPTRLDGVAETTTGNAATSHGPQTSTDAAGADTVLPPTASESTADESTGIVTSPDLGQPSSGRSVISVAISQPAFATVCVTDDAGRGRCWGDLAKSAGYGFGDVDGGSSADAGALGDLPLRSALVELFPRDGACGRFADGTVACWHNAFDATGTSPRFDADDAVVAPPVVPLPSTVRVLDVGARGVCAITEEAELYCWGFGTFGQLGYGNTEQIGDDETPLDAGPVELGAPALDIALSEIGTACAVLEGGGVRCWGNNEYAGLGHPELYDPIYDDGGVYENLGDDELPTSVGLVDVGAPATAVAVAARASCALLDSGGFRCWGRTFASPGWVESDLPPSAAPMHELEEPIISLAVANRLICVLTESGVVRCFGPEAWERGYGGAPAGEDASIETLAEAPAMPLGRPATAIAIADSGACALLDDGTLRCWGSEAVHGHATIGYLGDDEVPTDWPVVPVFGP